jgi:lysophospholipase L1-like esterase
MRRPLTIIAIAGLGCASLVLNAWLALLLYRAFVDLQYARVFPIGPPLTSQPAAPGDARPLIVFYGDSRSLHWNTDALSRGFRVLNLAQGGMTSAQLSLQLQARPPVRSDWALVEIGVNDLHPLGALRGRAPLIRAQLDADLAQIVGTLQERSACIIVATIIPPGPTPLERKLTWDDTTLEEIAQANRSIAGLARPGRVWILDAHGLLRDDASRLAARYRLAGSFLHVNSQGYDVLNRELLRILVNNRAVEPLSNLPALHGPPQSSGGSPCLIRYKG